MAAAIVADDVRRRRVSDGVALAAVAVSFGFSQPILDLLGRNPPFFQARGAPAVDVVGVGLLVAVGLPAVAALLAHVWRRVGSFLMAGLGLFALGVRIPAVFGLDSDVAWLAGGVASVVGIRLAHDRWEGVRSAVRMLVAAPVLFLILFLAASPTGGTLGGAAVELPPAALAGAAPPIVMIVFDEFPLASVIDGDGELRGDWYPNLSRLAADSVWFRNAATVQQQTDMALPAILTGVEGRPGALPVLADHPANLFTLLRDSHEIRSIEVVTSLCPEPDCATIGEQRSASDRWRTLLSDLVVVGGHGVLPPLVTESLPSIDSAWANFGLVRFEDRARDDRSAIVDAFAESVATGPAGTRPTLQFMHVLLPHRPWEHLPTGQVISSEELDPPGFIRGGWTDAWAADLAFQRHLLEVHYLDRALGTVLDALEKSGDYDETLVVVTADHGVSIRADSGALRTMSASNVGEIGAVPLFIKLPGSVGAGTVSDFRAISTDILPTIADALGVEVPWPVDGVSLFGDVLPERQETVTAGPSGPVSWPSTGAEKLEAARRIEELFPGGDILGLVPPGAGPLLGTDAAKHAECRDCRVDDPDAWDAIVDGASPFPAAVEGTMVDGRPGRLLGVAVNGTVVAATRSFVASDGRVRFSAVVAPDQFSPGRNTVALVLLD